MDIEKIIYESTREIYSLEDKLRIATIFLFCEKLGNSKLAELLYTDNHEKLILDITEEFNDYDVDFHINFSNSNVKSAFNKTLEKVKKVCDDNGYLKALFNKDEYALVIEGIVNYNFDKVEFKQFTKNIVQQLTFDFSS
ncbi:hypothetical protein [Flavobacterium fluviatile]|uniref:hypothetical protein n=1 Tax=Flavobacterium fluviatile TaxID=1862387 RepID=UPI0013D55331|nr:hypothetical protein [Flavobacterium fluviatile]